MERGELPLELSGTAGVPELAGTPGRGAGPREQRLTSRFDLPADVDLASGSPFAALVFSPVSVLAPSAPTLRPLPGRQDQIPAPPPRRTAWADLLKRVFEVDALVCPECGGRMRILAAITDPDVARRILDCLGLPPRAPPIARDDRSEVESANEMEAHVVGVSGLGHEAGAEMDSALAVGDAEAAQPEVELGIEFDQRLPESDSSEVDLG